MSKDDREEIRLIRKEMKDNNKIDIQIVEAIKHLTKSVDEMKENMKNMAESHVTKTELQLQLALFQKEIDDNKTEITLLKEDKKWMRRAFWGAIVASSVGVMFTVFINVMSTT